MHLLLHTLGRIEILRSRNDHQHELCVGTVAEIISRQVGIDQARASAIGRAAALHDIGKLVLPDAVLHKPASLSIAESETIKMHCKLGYDLLGGNDNSELQLAATIALRHHERADGSGYPDRLSCKDIPIEARISALADVYSALREPRAYKQPMGHDQALRIIADGDERIRPQYFDTTVLRGMISAGHEIEQEYAVQVMLN